MGMTTVKEDQGLDHTGMDPGGLRRDWISEGIG